MAMTEEERKEKARAYARKYREANKEKLREKDRQYRESHKEQIKEYQRAYRQENKEQLNAKVRERYRKNPDAFAERKARYVASHKEQVREANQRYRVANKQKRTDYERNKRQNDPIYRFRTSFRCLIGGYLRKKGYKGGKTAWEVVGCDFDTFLEYIEKQFEEGMTLDNYGHGEGKWNIDHIIPISTAESDEDMERLNHYTNLRPMWASDNYKKSKKML